MFRIDSPYITLILEFQICGRVLTCCADMVLRLRTCQACLSQRLSHIFQKHAQPAHLIFYSIIYAHEIRLHTTYFNSLILQKILPETDLGKTNRCGCAKVAQLPKSCA